MFYDVKAPKPHESPPLVCWQPPDEGWIKLNVDGACDLNSKSMAAGGILRDHLGNWISGFQKFLGSGDSRLVECWSALLGINLAVSLNITHLWIESDCSILIDLLSKQDLNHMHHLAPMIFSCRSSLRHFRNIKISHIFREGNRCADAIAANALISPCNFTLLNSCPSFVAPFCTMDRLGFHTPRGIG